jgi:hypothetical protein
MGLLDDAIREHLDLKRQRGADPGEVERLEREALGPVRREPTARSLGAQQIEAHTGPESHLEPATQLLEAAAPTHEPKRGFLRRHRSAPTPRPEASDFAEHPNSALDGMHGEAGGHPLEHPDPFGQDQFDSDDPFPNDAPAGHDDPLTHEEPATYEHGGPFLNAEPSAAVDDGVAFEPPQLLFESPPPRRPTFAPVPPEAPGDDDSPAPADAAEVAPAVDHARADTTRETREWSVEDAFAEEDSDPAALKDAALEEDVLEETPEFLQDTPDHDRLWFEQRPPRDFDFEG